MNLHKLYSIFFLPLIVSLLTMVVTGCSDDGDEVLQSQYGYVQFKLYKSTSFEKGTTTRATDKLETLSSAQKIKVVMTHNGTTVSQTVPLNAYNANNAEYGLRSDKLQLLAGTYKIIGYYLYDKLDEVLLAGPGGDDSEFTVVGQGLQEKALAVDAVARGTVTFKLTKEGLSTRAVGEYLFSNIRYVDVTVMNTFTRVTTEMKGMKVTYEEGSKENQNPDNANDKYMDIGVATCDSAVWLPAGTFQVVAYTTYTQSGGTRPVLETQSVRGEPFTVKDNELTEDANVPIQLKETAEYIKDYKALKIIWEALDGKNWKYNGGTVNNTVSSSNWNFNKELDMWGDQPGVDLDNNGRVIGLSLAGFGAKGRVPDAIGQLTELKTLSFGTHSEILSGRLFGEDELTPDMSEEQKQRIRMHYKRTFLVGLAFLSICAFWQMYDNIVPLILQGTFHLNETLTGAIMAADNVLAVFLLPLLGSLSDKADTRWGKRTPFIVVGTVLAVVLMMLLPHADKTGNFVLFVISLFFLLIAMGLYRSPAVALMPDLTPKPLRSQANAIINLMGAVGGIYTLILISLLLKGGDKPDYTPVFLGVALLMVVAVVLLVLTVREKKLAQEVAKANLEEETEEEQKADKTGELTPGVKRSLTMILISIFLWFTAYNAVTTAFSRYARTVWGMEGGGFANCLMVATVAAIISYIPIGMISAKVGRKKTIMGGLVLMLISFFVAIFFTEYHAVINLGFALIGMGWAAVSVNSLPMVVEMCSSEDVGKYTGLYYTFSMSAQIVTPILSGAFLQYVSYRTLFPYACVFTVAAMITMSMVHHGDNKPERKKNLLENFDVED
jgi:Na+/melibiose symporter-like transporter